MVSFLVAAVSAALPGIALAQSQASITLERLSEGRIVSRLSSGSGISGAPVTGSVGVFGASSALNATANAAMIYDASCPDPTRAFSCSGGEDDKYKPQLGKVLVIARDVADANGDGRVDNPDVQGGGGEFRFDFTTFGTGTVTVASLDVLDVERAGSIELFAEGELVSTVPIPVTGNNGLATVALGQPAIDRMEVTLRDSGAIDNVRLVVPEGAFAPPPLTPPTARACGSLRVGVRSLAVGRRTVVPVTVRDTRRARFARMRVVARGAGVRTSGLTRRTGVVRLVVKPRRAGTVRFYVPRSSRCASRVRVRGTFRPPGLTG